MKFFKNKLNKKVLFVVISTAFLLFLGSTQFTHAQLTSGIPTASGFVSLIASSLSYLIAFIFGVLIAIEAWFIGIVLNINANIFQTALVQTGFSISLSIANLAFVLGIIVIALATILRNQTYGIKQLLWKLVVMAILVNFGLVIMSPIFAIGNSFTQYFLNCINPGSGGCTQSASGLSSFSTFGTTFASAFNPANPWVAPATASGATLAAANNLTGAFSAAGSSIGQAAVPIFGIIFVAIDLALIVIILGVFIAMLTVRYLYIAILAILLPFAWASWVFPSFNSHWKKWWELFIRWTFFAPLVLFFIYLALLTMKGVGAAGIFDPTTYMNGGNNSAWSAISGFLSGAISPIISSFLQEILLGGLILGGMMAANSMGIKMAGATMDIAKKGGNAAKSYTQKQAKKGGAWAYQKTDQGVRKVSKIGLTERLQTGKLGVFNNVPGVRRGSSLLARGIQSSSVGSNAEIVEEAQKKAPKSWETAKKNLEGSMNTEDQFAHIAVGIKEGKITANDKVNGKTVAEFLDDKDMVARYGQQKLVSDFDKVTLSDANSRRAQMKIDNISPGDRARIEELNAMGVRTKEQEEEREGLQEVTVASDVKDEQGNVIYKAGSKAPAEDLRRESDRQFWQNTAKADFSKANVNEFFSPKAARENPDQFQNKLDSLANYRPEVAADLMKKMNGVTLQKFADSYEGTLDKVIENTKSQVDALGNLGVRTQEQSEEFARASTKLNRLNKGRHGFEQAYTSVFGHAGHEEHNDDHGGGKGGGGKKDKGSTSHSAPTPHAEEHHEPAPTNAGGGGGHGH